MHLSSITTTALTILFYFAFHVHAITKRDVILGITGWGDEINAITRNLQRMRVFVHPVNTNSTIAGMTRLPGLIATIYNRIEAEKPEFTSSDTSAIIAALEKYSEKYASANCKEFIKKRTILQVQNPLSPPKFDGMFRELGGAYANFQYILKMNVKEAWEDSFDKVFEELSRDVTAAELVYQNELVPFPKIPSTE
ncbi:hypothetical protein DFH27DRAFT_654997 [Peziza echinospora]|nr:hypothetical protein DFH27DRAFT_654997 [Peziza echinospora]